MISPKAFDKIRKIVEENYRAIFLPGLLRKIYFHNLLNEGKDGPTSIAEMDAQQKGQTVEGHPHVHVALEHLSENLRALVEKQKTQAQASIEGVLRDFNLETRNRMLRGLEGPGSVDEVKRRLQDIAGEASRRWTTVAVTETANAVGMGSVDRIVENNREVEPEDIYVFRIPVNDAALCRWCRRFYLDSDGSPAVYRLSTLLANGSNYGKKPNEWLPVVGVNHPNDRETGAIQLKRGWKVLPEGRLEFVGEKDWESYIKSKLRG